jgi:hypothetical protein
MTSTRRFPVTPRGSTDLGRLYAIDIIENLCNCELWHCDLPERRFTPSEAHEISPRELEFKRKFDEYWPRPEKHSAAIETQVFMPSSSHGLRVVCK